MKSYMPVINGKSLNKGISTILFLSLLLQTIFLPGCIGKTIEKSVDKIVNEIDQTRQTIAQESTGWRQELPKLVDSLNGMESQISADVQGILADTTNQVNDLATQTLQMTDAKAQDLISQAGVEFRCNADFVKSGTLAQLQFLIDDLKFWKQNRTHLHAKPSHSVCWINPSALTLVQTGSGWTIDVSNTSDPKIVHVFGYNFQPEAMPTLELQNGSGQRIRDVNLVAAYVTHYQINLDFANEDFQGIANGARAVFRWPDLPEPNTINLTLKTSANLKISNPVFTPSQPIAGVDPVILRVTITNKGGTRSGNFTVEWKPDPTKTTVLTVSSLPLEAEQSIVVAFSGYTYTRDGTISSVVSIQPSGYDTQTYPLTVKAKTSTPIPIPTSYDVEVVTGTVSWAGTDADVYISIYGTTGNLLNNYLDMPGYNDFENGDDDHYTITSDNDIGDIRMIQIRHDNSGSGPGWYLARITIKNLRTGKTWYFPCNRWLADDEEDHHIYRTIYPNGPCQ